jgi:hypothetical protein
MRSIFSGSIPGPESFTATRTPAGSCLVLINSSRGADRAHCFDRVQEQVQDHLLQLNAIAVNGK